METKEIIQLNSIYLAAAVDLSDTDPFKEMAKRLKPATCFMPKAAFANAADFHGDEFLVKVNFSALRNADAIVALIDGKTPSIGMPMEIIFAAMGGTPVIIVDASKDGSLAKKSIYARTFAHGIITMKDLSFEKVREIMDYTPKKKQIEELIADIV